MGDNNKKVAEDNKNETSEAGVSETIPGDLNTKEDREENANQTSEAGISEPTPVNINTKEDREENVNQSSEARIPETTPGDLNTKEENAHETSKAGIPETTPGDLNTKEDREENAHETSDAGIPETTPGGLNTNEDREENANETSKAGTSGTAQLRRSQRSRGPGFKIYQSPLDKRTKPVSWTKKEKAQLLEGLKTVGDKNVLGLNQYVPKKNPKQIADFIAYLKRKSLSQQSHDDPYYFMDMWIRRLRSMAKPDDRLKFCPLPCALLLISLFEEFPKPSEAGGIDFKQLYEYMFCQMCDLPLPDLDKSTKHFFYRALMEVEKDIVNNMDEFIEVIRNSEDVDDEWPYNDPLWNPLNFPKLQLNVTELDQDSD